MPPTFKKVLIAPRCYEERHPHNDKPTGRRDGAMDSHIAAEIGDKTVALISTTYGDTPGGKPLSWLPSEGLPAWHRWLPAAQKIARIA